ncbi:MAG: hypothetical protein CM15mP120_13470 [Pseudomonadota bacterium]|nr:MAG: hypothetical protein CM15mP120_13470 [Pseudomonadota bacterium]
MRDGKIEAGYPAWLRPRQNPRLALVSAVPFWDGTLGIQRLVVCRWRQQLTENLYPATTCTRCCAVDRPNRRLVSQQIISLDDVEGLKIRFAGLGGRVIERLGASVP